MSETGFVFEMGAEYETQAGDKVRVIGRTTVAGAECLQCSDGMYRYDRKGQPHDAGRVTGTAHDYSFPGNFKRMNMAPCEVGREWRKCWRDGCDKARLCVAPNV